MGQSKASRHRRFSIAESRLPKMCPLSPLRPLCEHLCGLGSWEDVEPWLRYLKQNLSPCDFDLISTAVSRFYG